MADKKLLDLRDLSVALETSFKLSLYIPELESFKINYNIFNLDEERVSDIVIPFPAYSYNDLELGGVKTIGRVESVDWGDMTITVVDTTDLQFLRSVLKWEAISSGKVDKFYSFLEVLDLLGFMQVNLCDELGRSVLIIDYIISYLSVTDLPLRRVSNSPLLIQVNFKVHKINVSKY